MKAGFYGSLGNMDVKCWKHWIPLQRLLKLHPAEKVCFWTGKTERRMCRGVGVGGGQAPFSYEPNFKMVTMKTQQPPTTTLQIDLSLLCLVTANSF